MTKFFDPLLALRITNCAQIYLAHSKSLDTLDTDSIPDEDYPMTFIRKEVRPKFWVDFYNQVYAIFKPNSTSILDNNIEGGWDVIGRSYTMYVGDAFVKGIIHYDENEDPDTFEIQLKLRNEFSVLIRLRLDYLLADLFVINSGRYHCDPTPETSTLVFYSQEYTDEEIEQMLTTEILRSKV
jgi:hypothetical protein